MAPIRPQAYRRPGKRVISTGIRRLRAFAASTDGSLLDDATWRSRHQRIAGLCWVLNGFVWIYTIADNREGIEWIFAPTMTALLVAAASNRGGRRIREVAVAATFGVTQVFASRYVGNVSGFGAIYIIVLTFYQDWVPIVFACVVALCLVVIAAVDPAFFEGNEGFQKEVPLTGMTFRALAIVLAASLAFAVWRYGTQLARDQLTGMLSRAGAERTLQQELDRGRQPVAWACDLDNFRAVNGELGSAAGDKLLRHVAAELRRVAATLPGGWLCARLRADTFLVAVYNSPGDAFIERFAHRIETEAGVPAAGIALDDIPVRFSVGAVVAVPGDTGAELIRAAEDAMRRAKGQGNQRVVVERRKRRRRASSTEQASSLLISEIYRGCHQSEFDVHLQPIVSLKHRQPVGAEALVRWNHPARGLLYPGVFIADAERDSALMALLSRTVGERFVAHVSRLVERHGVDWLSYGYAFNLAAIRFRDPTLVDSMGRLLGASGLAHPEWKITLEITEGALMDIEHRVPELLKQLRQQGYKIALDDFGVGHSSLAHLRDFPLDTVKIDQSFAQSVDRSPIDRAVVQAVSDIAAATGVQVVAEGVETEAQREILLSINPDFLAQGWLFAKALPVEEFEAWVLEQQRLAVV
jgi:diguanylate cyclase (GGDEF)-like protein